MTGRREELGVRIERTETPAPPAKRRARPRYVLWGGAAVVLAATAGSMLAYGARRELARDALVGWLEQRGVESEVEFQTFDWGAVMATSGALTIGVSSCRRSRPARRS